MTHVTGVDTTANDMSTPLGKKGGGCQTGSGNGGVPKKTIALAKGFESSPDVLKLLSGGCSVFQGVAECFGELQCVAVIHIGTRAGTRCHIAPVCSVGRWWVQCVAVCCSVLQCVAVLKRVSNPMIHTRYSLRLDALCCNVLQCVTLCRSVLQRVAACCSVLQRVAAYCSVLHCVSVHASVSSQCLNRSKKPT